VVFFLLALLLIAIVQCKERQKEQKRRVRVLNFSPGNRSSNSLSRRDSQDSYLNQLRENIRDLV
jgi:hypothetical protein